MQSGARIRSLDGLRGVGAIIVMFFHWWLLNPTAWAFVANDTPPPRGSSAFLFALTPLNLLLAGGAAVSMFFVMSGTVLALTFREVDKGAPIPFILKRFCRIYIPYITAVVLSLIAMQIVAPTPIEPLSAWFNTYAWSHPVEPVWLLNYVLMTNHDTTLDPVVWSLAHELRISLFFPLLFLLLLRGRLWALIGVTALSLTAEFVLTGTDLHWSIRQLLSSISYLWLFAFGVMLYLTPPPPVEKYLQACSSSWVAWLVPLGLISWSARIDPLAIQTPAFVISGVGAILVVALGLRPNWIAEHFLASGPAVWLGKISYSLYLVHIPVLLATNHLFYGKAAFAILIVGGTLTSIGLAWIVATTIERWSQSLGRQLAARYQRSMPHRAASLPFSETENVLTR